MKDSKEMHLAKAMIKEVTGSRESNEIEKAIQDFIIKENLLEKIGEKREIGEAATFFPFEKMEPYLDKVENIMEEVFNSGIKMTYD